MSTKLTEFLRRMLNRYGVRRSVVLTTINAICASVLITVVVMFLFMDGPDLFGLLIAAIIPSIISPVISFIMLETIAKLEDTRQQLQELANTDSLTHSFNRRYFMERLEIEWQTVKRYGGAFSILIFDIDDFKNVNDTYGHAIGDVVLKMITDTSLHHIRQTDLFSRYGGEEFAIILPRTDGPRAREVGERLRTILAVMDVSVPDGMIRITVSVGLATSTGLEDNPDQILVQADKALYAAKRTGKNRVVMASTYVPV